jgi:hypothetical protein
MIDRFMSFESDTFCTNQKIKQMNARAAALTRNSITCFIITSLGLAEPINYASEVSR